MFWVRLGGWSRALGGWCRALGRDRALLFSALALLLRDRAALPSALRRLAADDARLRRAVGRLPERLDAGQALGTALAAEGLLTPADAAAFDALPADALAAACERRAVGAGRSDPLLLSRWYPVWVVAIMLLPMTALVVLVEGLTRQGFVSFGDWFYAVASSAVGLGADIKMPSMHTPSLALNAGLVITAAALVWWGLRSVPQLAPLTAMYGIGAERAALALRLIRAARVGGRWRGDFTRWRWLAGIPHRAQGVLAHAGGDLGAALVDLAVVPRGADGRADWQAAEAHWTAELRTRADAAAPLLRLGLVVIALVGFRELMSGDLASSLDDFGAGGFQSPGLTLSAIMLLLLLPVTAGFLAVLRRMAGDPAAWRRAARVLAETIAAGRPVPEACERLALGTAWPRSRTWRELARATAASDAADLVRQLAAVGILPRARRPAALAVAAGGAATTVGWLRREASAPDAVQATLERLRVQAVSFALGTSLLIGMLAVLGVFWSDMMHRAAGDAPSVSDRIVQWLMVTDREPSAWLLAISKWLGVKPPDGPSLIGGAFPWLALCIVLCLLIAWIHRRGWWPWQRGALRRLRAHLLIDHAARGASEAELARLVAPTWRRPPTRLALAAVAGDTVALIRVCGWRAGSFAALALALDAAQLRAARWRLRLAALAQFLLPVLFGLPVLLAGLVLFLMPMRQLIALRGHLGFTP